MFKYEGFVKNDFDWAIMGGDRIIRVDLRLRGMKIF